MSFIFEKVLLLSLTLSGVVLAVPSDVQIACRDETGKAVDWFSAYKLPKDSDSADANIQQGAGYTYLTENKQDWTLSKVGFDSTGSIIAKTLDSFYKTTFAANSPTGYVLYNDQYEEAELASRAHAKGVIYFDSKTAVWIGEISSFFLFILIEHMKFFFLCTLIMHFFVYLSEIKKYCVRYSYV